jgi:hypothetical protein
LGLALHGHHGRRADDVQGLRQGPLRHPGDEPGHLFHDVHQRHPDRRRGGPPHGRLGEHHAGHLGRGVGKGDGRPPRRRRLPQDPGSDGPPRGPGRAVRDLGDRHAGERRDHHVRQAHRTLLRQEGRRLRLDLPPPAPSSPTTSTTSTRSTRRDGTCPRSSSPAISRPCAIGRTAMPTASRTPPT